MTQQTKQQIQIEASPQRCFEAILDFESYPKWASDIKNVKVQSRDSDGRGVLVYYEVSSMGRGIDYTLQYFYGTEPLRCSWQLVESQLLALLTGKYEFQPNGDRQTNLVYELGVEPKVKLPGFFKRRAETRIIHTALDDLQRYIES